MNELSYKVVDDSFTGTGLIISGRASSEAALVIEYEKRDLPVAKNVARLYMNSWNAGRNVKLWFTLDADWIDTTYPELEYSKRYLPCVLRQFKQQVSARNEKNH